MIPESGLLVILVRLVGHITTPTPSATCQAR